MTTQNRSPARRPSPASRAVTVIAATIALAAGVALAVYLFAWPSEANARAALVTVLDEWRLGRTPAAVVSANRGRIASVADADFSRGVVLLRYDLGPAVSEAGGGVTIQATLFFQTVGGAESRRSKLFALRLGESGWTIRGESLAK